MQFSDDEGQKAWEDFLAQWKCEYPISPEPKYEWTTDELIPKPLPPGSYWIFGENGWTLHRDSPRKRPAELDDKDRKNPWGHIPYHN